MTFPTKDTASHTVGPQIFFRETVIDGYRTGALDIFFEGRRVISVPSQLGCRVGCSFCVSRHLPLIRNLTADEIFSLARHCLDVAPADGRPLELSFTGEGEPLLNWKNTQAATRLVSKFSGDFDSVRYCLSGIGASRLLERIAPEQYPTRLQFSLHAARQLVRDRLVPRSESLDSILKALRKTQSLFTGIELNVVLQDTVNDSNEDLIALCGWGNPEWPVLLNPILADGLERVAARTELFESALISAGRLVKRYTKVAARISRQGIYPMMSARRTGPSEDSR